MNRLMLRDDMVAAFTPDEFTKFCKGLGFPYEELGGRAHSDKVGSLIGKLDRNGRLPVLISAFVKARPQWAARYQDGVSQGSDGRDAHLLWLEELAAGEGNAIEEPPTMKWDSAKHSPDEE
jgi:hypothetical protein